MSSLDRVPMLGMKMACGSVVVLGAVGVGIEVPRFKSFVRA